MSKSKMVEDPGVFPCFTSNTQSDLNITYKDAFLQSCNTLMYSINWTHLDLTHSPTDLPVVVKCCFIKQTFCPVPTYFRVTLCPSLQRAS